MFIVHRIIFILNIPAILALLVSYLAPFITPELAWPVAFLGLGYPMLLLINILFIVYWAIFLRLKFMFSLAAIIIGWNYIPRFVQINAKQKPEPNGHDINIVTFNTRYFGHLDNFISKEQELFFDKLDRIHPDIICLQEMFNGAKMDNPIIGQFQKKYSTWHLANINMRKGRWTGDNLGIISRYPIVRKGIVEHDSSTFNYTIFADIMIHDDTVRVVSTHLQSIRFRNLEVAAYENLKVEDVDSVELSTYRSIAQKMKYAFVFRSKQAEAIRRFIDESPLPVIVCGDFNDSPTSYAYRMIRGPLNDAFIEAGSGFGRTYVGKMPNFRIDYILADPSFSLSNYYAKAFDFSDHKMVSCTVRLREK